MKYSRIFSLGKLCFLKKNNSFKPESKRNPKYYDLVAIFCQKYQEKYEDFSANAWRLRFPLQIPKHSS